MKKNVILSIVLGLLVVISAVQALQLSGLKAKVSDASFITGSNQKFPVGSGGSSQSKGNTVATDISNLPGMVGGC